jgi:hypothetical protein
MHTHPRQFASLSKERGGAVCICMKGKEIAKGKKGKAETRMQKRRSERG